MFLLWFYIVKILLLYFSYFLQIHNLKVYKEQNLEEKKCLEKVIGLKQMKLPLRQS